MISARDVMTRDVATIAADTSIERLIKTIKSKHYSGLPVVDADGCAIGVVSQNDVLRALAFVVSNGKLGNGFQADRRQASQALLEASDGAAVEELLQMPVKKIMTASVHSCAADTPLAEICEQMTAKRIHRLVVLDEDEKVVGLVTATDVVRWLGQSLKSSAGSP